MILKRHTLPLLIWAAAGYGLWWWVAHEGGGENTSAPTASSGDMAMSAPAAPQSVSAKQWAALENARNAAAKTNDDQAVLASESEVADLLKRWSGGGVAKSSPPSKPRAASQLGNTTDSHRGPNAEPLGDSAIDRALSALPIGSIAFNTPEEIPLGETAIIELLLSMQDAESSLAGEVRGPGAVETARVRFSQQMQADLRGLGFEIEQITPELQAVSRSERTRWRWQIKPIETDAQPLHLTLSARVRVDGEPMTRTIETFEREIRVRVTLVRRARDFVVANSQVVFTALLVPLAAATWRQWRRKKRRAAADRDSEQATPTRRAA